MSPARRDRRRRHRALWRSRRCWLRRLRGALGDPSLTYDEALQIRRLVFDSVGVYAWGASLVRHWGEAALCDPLLFRNEARIWWDAALLGGPRRRALARLKEMRAYPWSRRKERRA